MKKRKKGASRILALLLSVMMFISMLPMTVFAADNQSGKVRVIVENTTYTENEAPWTGTLVDTWVDLQADSSMMSCIVDALENYSHTGADTGYISEVNGLKAADENAGPMSGWMGTLNDWFTNEGFEAFTVEKGTLAAGDEIRLMYSCDGGEDLGGSWSGTDKTVKSLSFSEGTLTPAFNKDIHTYTLAVKADVDGVTVTPTASNKNYQVRTSVNGKEYKRTESVPVTDGAVITVKCGDPSWPSASNNNGEAQVYTVTVKQEKAPSINVSIRSQMEGGYLHSLEQVEVSADTAETYGYTDSVEGVSALDALVKAHELIFGADFTKEDAGNYLKVSSSGWISVIFGVETSANGFYLNQGYPNDGTSSEYGGYNGTTVTNTSIASGDVLDYYVMGDSDFYSDYYTWVDAPDEMKNGEQITVVVKGFYAMEGYHHKDPASLKAAAKPLEGVQLAWVDLASGETRDINGAVTDENGEASFTVAEGATGYLVAKSYGNAEEYERVYTIMNPSEKIKELPIRTVDLKGLHNAQLNFLKLYTYINGEKGTTDLLEGKETVADGYNLKYAAVELPVGNYWVEGYDSNGDYNGGMVVSVKEDTTAITVYRAYEIYASNKDWVQDTDYTIDYQVVGADGVNRKAEMGTADSWGSTRASGLFQALDTIKVTLTPIGDRAADYMATTVTKTGANATNINLSISASIPKAIAATVTAPAGSTVSMGVFGDYYSYEFVEEDFAETEGDTLTARFRIPTTTKNHFLRVQHPDGVTYWTFGKWTTEQTFTVTKEDLHIGDKEFTKDTVYRFEKNKYDRADIYLNINSKGYMNMDVGQTFELNVFRNWMALENTVSNAQVALPDMHYQVVDLQGRPSDVVTITPDKNNNSLSTLKANKEGTAIVLVTYDAMTHMQGLSSTDSKEFSAIWPECTGVFVVSVGADGSAIQTNMFMDRMGVTVSKPEQKDIDAEHDILFYLGDEGAEYTFTPESGCTVTVARSIVDGSAMSFNGFTSDGVITDATTGEVTVTNLTSGRHIVRVEKDGAATYQVITARGVRYDLIDTDGNILPASTEFKAGDKVTIQFHNLISPKEKLSGVYNFNFSLSYQGEDDTSFSSKPGGSFGVYDFSGNPERQKIEITIPETWEELSYNLTGAIKVGGFGGVPTHRGVSYTKGMDRQYGTSTATVLSRLPELSLKLEGWAVSDVQKKIEAIGTVTLDSEETIQAARSAYDALTEEQKKQINNYGVLKAAENRLSDLKAADEVENKINAIGTVTLDSEETIQAARTAYNSLTAEQKELVSNYKTLVAAEEAFAELSRPQADFEEIYKATGDYLASLGTPGVGSTGGEWSVLGLARSGREVQEEYYNAVVAFIRENINDNEQIHPAKSTENSRIILALTALGLDVTDVDGHNLLQGLTDMDYVTAQGINGPIFALIAFDSHKYEIPAGDVTRDKLIAYILGEQLSDGGWALSGNTSDPDTTAMALQALTPYYKTNADVKAVVDKALVCLSDMQQPTGGYSSRGTTNAESCAQVIVALTALGIDSDNDSRFIKNGTSVLDALLSFAVEDGGFKHVLDGGRNQMATEQGYYALVAYDRFLNDKTSLYNMSDVTINTDPDVPVSEDKDITLTDVTGTGVTVISKVSILNGMELEAKLLTSGELYDKVKEALKDGKFTLYDLYLLENNLEVQPDGTITVSIPVSDGYDGTKCNVYRVNEDGSVTEITAALKDGKLVFETDQMGAFAIYQPAAVEPTNSDRNGGTTDSPQTGDSSNVALWFAMSLLSLAALTVLSRKKKTVK